ncbi:hypothetical protein MED217_14310 [Leeuwenhoekiella blandensis MED217]|uniref:DoxX family protein n=2 Tax=Leeuwenhoekiella TaxID=283735 RepID=A3XGM7_LEEBM|nr:hypothetical protein MED217_14310 [Leeuwenhoekiella blandensis MED217]
MDHLKAMKNKHAAYTLARLPIGFSFLGHGFIRIPKLSAFAQGMTNSFAETYLPVELVKPFALILPFVELLLGIALIIGFKAKETAAVGILLICVLIFGCSFQENWSAIGIQLFYGLYLAILFLFSEYNQGLFSKSN